MKNKGFTLIELMIIIAIMGIIAAVVVSAYRSGKYNETSPKKDENQNISFGFNGTTEVRCISGYKFVIGSRGDTTQILDSQGHGVSCF